jgi:hypothetical protein
MPTFDSRQNSSSASSKTFGRSCIYGLKSLLVCVACVAFVVGLLTTNMRGPTVVFDVGNRRTIVLSKSNDMFHEGWEPIYYDVRDETGMTITGAVANDTLPYDKPLRRARYRVEIIANGNIVVITTSDTSNGETTVVVAHDFASGRSFPAHCDSYGEVTGGDYPAGP